MTDFEHKYEVKLESVIFKRLDAKFAKTITIKIEGSVYFAINSIIAFRSILPQLHNPMSHEYYI